MNQSKPDQPTILEVPGNQIFISLNTIIATPPPGSGLPSVKIFQGFSLLRDPSQGNLGGVAFEEKECKSVDPDTARAALIVARPQVSRIVLELVKIIDIYTKYEIPLSSKDLEKAKLVIHTTVHGEVQNVLVEDPRPTGYKEASAYIQ